MASRRARPAPDEAAPGTVRPGSPASLRAANQRRVLAAVQSAAQSGGSLSQAELARSTGLAPATVSNIVRDLATAGLLETDVGSGRRGGVVRVARTAGLVVGVDVGHRHVGVAVGDVSGTVLADGRLAQGADDSYTAALDGVERLLDRLLADVGGTRDEVRHLGLGLPGPINGEGQVMSSAILPGWVGVEAHDAVVQRFGLPTHVENDANLGALAEHRIGAGVGHADMVFVKVSSGVGAGIVVGGEIFRGAGGTAGEVGHLTLDEQGPLCRCGGRGCLETYTSTTVAARMLGTPRDDAGIDELIQSAAQGNVAAVRVFEDAGLHLGWGLAMLGNILNPGIFVVGGDMARAGDLLLAPVRMGLRRHALPSVAADTLVVAAALGDRAPMIGALLAALDRTELIPAAGWG